MKIVECDGKCHDDFECGKCGRNLETCGRYVAKVDKFYCGKCYDEYEREEKWLKRKKIALAKQSLEEKWLPLRQAYIDFDRIISNFDCAFCEDVSSDCGECKINKEICNYYHEGDGLFTQYSIHKSKLQNLIDKITIKLMEMRDEKLWKKH